MGSRAPTGRRNGLDVIEACPGPSMTVGSGGRAGSKAETTRDGVGPSAKPCQCAG